ncbi:MAG: mannose-1-phosphate guanylyltransferase/mannose-6-phosphate isomerase [Betaproteobacteria bacterium]|nr:mannose-1-phosphate guanylyltransferase/mannose-6-phosphate isomerase [Betaproteobacteria bacterium]
MSILIPVILSGGAGTRLWPLSRELHPKPFMRLADGESLLVKTFLRAAELPGVTEVMTVTNREHYFHTRDEYQPALDTRPGLGTSFLLEPLGRNTAPAVAMAALALCERHGADAVMLVLAADHLIGSQPGFAAAVASASAQARAGKLATFGILPTAPETGFGYIEIDQGRPLGDAAFMAKRFVEKPDAATAERYVTSGQYYWNSGMFCFRADAILAALAEHASELLHQAEACWAASRVVPPRDGIAVEIDSAAFGALPNISIDYAVMEKANNVAVVPADFGWSDIGSWNAISDLVEADAEGNRVVGEAILVDARNTFVQSENRLVAAVGVHDLLIVDTPDAVLVADRARAQDVRHIVSHLKANGDERHRLHRTVHRPWGTYTVLEEGPRFKIKRIVVKPGAALSLQMHHHRSEHWVVVSGTAKVTNGEATLLVATDQSTYIPAGHRHRLENPGVVDLVMIEVQSGDYLGEDDIVRLEDTYGRA